jgi:prepilin-type N-terminal cleavage/methylation domain-containing protein
MVEWSHMGIVRRREHMRHKAFSIVELLIVMVIIAILAGLIIVTYTGIKTRAENTKTVNAVSHVIKAVTQYGVRNGNYPVTSTWPCIGSSSTCARVGGASTCFGIGGAVYNSAFNTTLKGVMTSVPEPSDQTMNCAGNSYSGAFYNKNDTSGGKTASIIYFLKGNESCQITEGTVAVSQQDDTTRCSVTLKTLP